MRARLGITVHSYDVVVLKLRAVPIGTALHLRGSNISGGAPSVTRSVRPPLPFEAVRALFLNVSFTPASRICTRLVMLRAEVRTQRD